MLVFVVFGLVLSCGVIIASHVVSTKISLSIAFPFWVAAEQKGGQG